MNIENWLESDIIQYSTLAERGEKQLIVRPTFYNKQMLIAGIVNRVRYNTLIVCTNIQDENRIKQLINPGIKNIVYTTYRKLALDKCKLNEEVKLIIFNEAHLIFGENAEKVIEQICKKWGDSARIGITSTPKRNDGKNIGVYFDNNIDNRYNIGTAINNHDISDIYYITSLNIEAFREYVKNRYIKSAGIYVNKIFDAVNLGNIMENAFKSIYNDWDSKRSISIVAFVNGGKALDSARKTLVDNISQYFNGYKIELFDSIAKFNQASKANADKVIYLIINPNLNSLDNNIADCVVLLQNTTSSIRYIKRIGFSLRTKSDSAPIILDLVNSIDSIGVTQENNTKSHFKCRTYTVSCENIKVNVYDARLDTLDTLNKIISSDIHKRSQQDIEKYHKREHEKFERIQRERYPWLYNSDGTPKNNKIIENDRLCKARNHLYNTILSGMQNIDIPDNLTYLDNPRYWHKVNRIYNNIIEVMRKYYFKHIATKYITWGDIDEQLRNLDDLESDMVGELKNITEGYFGISEDDKLSIYYNAVDIVKLCIMMNNLAYRFEIYRCYQNIEHKLSKHSTIKNGVTVRLPYFENELNRALCKAGYGKDFYKYRKEIEELGYNTLYEYAHRILMLKGTYDDKFEGMQEKFKKLQTAVKVRLSILINICSKEASVI